MTWVAAGVGGAAAIGGGALSFFGAQSQSKAMRDAMNQYIHYTQGQRDIFLKENAPVLARLKSFIPGEANYNPEADPTLKNIGENYGQGLRDVQRDVLGAGVHPGGVYTPGGSDRAAMLMGQNLTASKAQMMRDTQIGNERFAEGALPTYSPGLPATPMFDPSAFSAGVMPGAGSFLGPALSQTLNQAGGPIASALSRARPTQPGGSGNPYADANYGANTTPYLDKSTNYGSYTAKNYGVPGY
jgi:hypothetical protein